MSYQPGNDAKQVNHQLTKKPSRRDFSAPGGNATTTLKDKSGVERDHSAENKLEGILLRENKELYNQVVKVTE